MGKSEINAPKPPLQTGEGTHWTSTLRGRQQILLEQQAVLKQRQDLEILQQQAIDSALKVESDYQATYLRSGEDAADLNQERLDELTERFQEIIQECKVTLCEADGKPTAQLALYDYDSARETFPHLQKMISQGSYIIQVTANNTLMSKSERSNFKKAFYQHIGALEEELYYVIDLTEDTTRNNNFVLLFSLTPMSDDTTEQ